jgi:D-amino-acid oxidase
MGKSSDCHNEKSSDRSIQPEPRMTKSKMSALLPDPDFSCSPPECVFVAGVRPYRKKTYRLEAKNLGTKFVVHNYGHGGAGITMSWGCAAAVRDIVLQHQGRPYGQIAVLGQGVMGLTAATLLRDRGFEVSIYADLNSTTTSDVAGGQWAPSFVKNIPAEKNQFEAILRTAFKMHEDRINKGYGVSRRINYSKHQTGTSFDKVPHDIVPAPTFFPHLPFAHLNQPGWGYCTLLVEPPIFLKRLREDLKTDGVTPRVPFIHKTFGSLAEIDNLPQRVVVNCTGLGARKLFGDADLVPIKGQLVLLKAQPSLDYLYSSDETYVFPRSDHVVVGGSHECNVNNTDIDNIKCAAILKMAKDVFSGHPMLHSERRDWMLKNK